EQRRKGLGVLVGRAQVEDLLEREHVGAAARDDEVAQERQAIGAAASRRWPRTEDPVEDVQARDGDAVGQAGGRRGRRDRPVAAGLVRANGAAELRAIAGGVLTELDVDRRRLRRLEPARERAAALHADLSAGLPPGDRDRADAEHARGLIPVAPALLR